MFIARCEVSDFKKLVVWQKGHALALHAHRVATGIRRRQDVPLSSQIIRAAMSIPANIVEGRRQKSEKEFARFLQIALNSGFELEYHDCSPGHRRELGDRLLPTPARSC